MTRRPLSMGTLLSGAFYIGLAAISQPSPSGARYVFFAPGRKRYIASASGGCARPGPPSRSHSEMTVSACSSSTRPSHIGRPPARCPRLDGETTTTFERSHGPRQSLVRKLPTPSTMSRRLASRASWSIVGCFFAVPQQHPRHTVTVGLDWSNATSQIPIGCGEQRWSDDVGAARFPR